MVLTHFGSKYGCMNDLLGLSTGEQIDSLELFFKLPNQDTVEFIMLKNKC